MPQKTGFDLLNELTAYTFQIIFVTAFDQYAIKAIKFSALDYLLKPINYKELKEAVKRAEQKNNSAQFTDQIKSLLHQINDNSSIQKIALPLANEIRFVALTDIQFCQSENNYTIFCLVSGEKIIVSKGLYEFQETLPVDVFIRCHQSYIVNKTHVKSFHFKDGIYSLEMNDKNEVPVSRAKKEFVRSSLL
jgi:two-component system LytT family response regulator